MVELANISSSLEDAGKQDLKNQVPFEGSNPSLAAEINEKQYRFITKKYSGIVFHRKENNRFFIKSYISKFNELILNDLKNIK